MYRPISRTPSTRYALAVLAGVAALGLRAMVGPFYGSDNPYHTVWAAVAFAAWFGGIGPALLTTAIGGLGVWYWFLPPVHSFELRDNRQISGLVGFVLLSGVIAAIGEASRRAIAEREAAEKEARAAHNLFRTFMDNTPASTFLKDADGKYVFANRTVIERFRLPSPEGKTDFDLFPTEDAAKFREHDNEVLTRAGPHEFVERTQESDGEHIWLSVKFPVDDGRGRKLLGGMSIDVTERERAQEELQRVRQGLESEVKARSAELRTANDSLRELSGRLLQLQDAERRRIARELHDSVGQLLAAMSMNLGSVMEETAKLSPQAASAVVENERMVQEIIREVRTISHLLHPPLLDEAGLVSALQWYVEGFASRSKIEVKLDCSSPLKRLPPDLETAIFRIVQECLTNVHRHSNSSRAEVAVLENGNEVSVQIRDEGSGIPMEKLTALWNSSRTGVGLRGMRERVGQLNGTLKVDSGPRGTVVVASFPLVPVGVGVAPTSQNASIQ